MSKKTRKSKRSKKVSVKQNEKRISKLEQNVDRDTVFTDTDDQTVYSTAHVSSPISTIVGGVGESIVEEINIQGIIEITPDDLTDTSLVFIALVRDEYNSDPANDTPTWSNVFREQEVFSHRTILTSSTDVDPRFKIVGSRRFALARAANGTMKSKQYFRIKKRYKGLRCDMHTNSTPRRNGFYLMMIATVAINKLTVSTSSMVKYRAID